MRAFRLPLASSAALLVACSQSAPTPAQDGTRPAVTSTAPITRVPPTALPTPATTIPEPFRGVWDNAGGSCNPASDLRMDVGAVSIEFYESLGIVTGVMVESPNSIVVDLAMEGEGERWTRKNHYALSADGQELTASELGEAPDLNLVLKRCPN